MSDYWSMPPLWPGHRVFIVGGGPSLRGFDGWKLLGRPCIGVNNAGLDIVPWCDVLFFADRRWLEWNISRLSEHRGRYKITRQRPVIDHGDYEIHTLYHNRRDPISRLPWEVCGACGGGSAINLALHGGAKEIILLGFDMHDTGENNYHFDHREPSEPGMRAKHFVPAIERMAPYLEKFGVKVVNCTLDSALNCFPRGSLSDYL